MARNERDPKRERTWRRHIGRQAASGLTVRAYCFDHDLQESAFYFWRRTLAARDREAAAVPAFLPVTVLPPTPPVADSPIDVRLAGGHRVRVRAGCDRELLAAVLALLGGRSC
jgi:hypothetical protein